MLNFIRDRAKGWFAWVIVGLLIIPFALWGINEYFGTGGEQVIATVNGVEIEQGEFQQAFTEQRNRMRQMLGDQYDARLFDAQIRQRVIQDLVDRELMRQFAGELNYRVSEEMVAATIRSIEEFRENGVFSANVYQRVLQSEGLTPTSFEKRVLDTLLVRQLPEGLVNTILVTDHEVNELIRLQEQRRDFQYLLISAGKFRNESVATAAAVEKFYQENPQLFMSPEQVRVEYLELDSRNLLPTETPDEAALQDFYQAHLNQYQVPEQRKVRHILIEVAANADDATLKAARDKAEALLARIRSGESFADIARASSDDAGSAAQGGDLGFFGRGVMDAAFESAAFALKRGEVSGIVQSSFGLHIIKAEEIQEGVSKTFAQVRNDVLAAYRQEQAIEKYFEQAEQLTNLAYENTDTLTVAADQLGLEIKKSDFFTQTGGAGLFADARLAAAAFKDDVLKQGFNSEPISIGDHHVVVLRLLEHREASQLPLAEVTPQIRKHLIDTAARAAAAKTGAESLGMLSSGEDAQAVARLLGAGWNQAKDVVRNSDSIDQGIVEESFRLKKPQQGAVSVGSTTLANGDIALIRLSAVREGDPAVFDAATRAAFKRRLATEYGNHAQRYLIEALRAKAKIQINSDEPASETGTAS